MRSNEEFDLGHGGIDTQYERDYINYRPNIRHTSLPVDANGDGLSVDTASQSGLGTVGTTSINNAWKKATDVMDDISKLEQELALKMEGITAPVSQVIAEDIKNAANGLGYPDVSDGIPFDLYKETFNHPSSPHARVIQDTYEDYMSDVNGSLNAEIYADVAEIQKDWEDMQDFVIKGLFAQVIPSEKVPNDLTSNEEIMQEISEKEKKMANEYAQLLKLKQVNRQIYMELSASEYGSERYYQAVKEYDDVKRQTKKIEKRLFTKTEMVDLIERKASDTNDSIELLQNTVDYDPYKEDKYELLHGLMKQFPSKDAAEKGLRKMQALLKLSVDGKKIKVNSVKSNLRGIAGRENKRKVNQTMVNGVHLRNEVFGEVYDVISNLDGVPGNRNFEVMMNHIADGVEQSEKMYRQQASDFYKIHAMDTSLRTDKMISLIDKDTTRSTYKLIGGVLDYAKNVNSTWPNEENLSGWLNDFMEHSKID